MFFSSTSDQFESELDAFLTLTSLINEEALINGEGGKTFPAGRVEKIFYYIKKCVEGGIFS